MVTSWALTGDVPINLTLFTLVEKALGRTLGVPARASSPFSLLKALAFFIPGTLVGNPCFLTYCTAMEHLGSSLIGEERRWSEGWDLCVARVQRKFQEDLGTIICNSAQLWIPVNAFTFYAVPVLFRTFWTSTFNVGWITYLSMVQHEEAFFSRSADFQRPA